MTLSRASLYILRTLIINGITAGVAIGLAANRRRNHDIPAMHWTAEQEAPFVSVVIPVRDEEQHIESLLKTLALQDYPAGRWGVTVVDDGSGDRTRELAERMAADDERLRVVQAPPLPPGWTGKNHALWTGMLAAGNAEWLLFVDADTRHHPLMLPSVVRRALCANADLLSLVITVETRSFWERLLVPQVGELYTLLVGTMDGVNGAGRTAAANGQFILIKQALYRAAGSRPEVRGDVAEDRALAQACKDLGANVRLEYGRNLVTSRVYSSLGELWRGYSKTLFWAGGHNTARTLLVVCALSMYAFLPLLTLGTAWFSTDKQTGRMALLHGLLQIVPMTILRGRLLQTLGISPLYALLYPLAVAVGNAMLLFSLYRVVSGKGVDWKGRNYRR